MNIVEPIRSKETLLRFKEELKSRSHRDYVIAEVGFQTGLRISDILPLKVSDILDHTHIVIREEKTNKHKRFPINNRLKMVVEEYVRETGLGMDDYLFPSRKSTGKNPYVTREQVFRSLNAVAKAVGIKDKIGTHTLRKTFGYHHYNHFKNVAVLQDIFNHSAPSITLKYIGINDDIIDKMMAGFEV
ncbi:site-specific integrase [Clostridium culturomicium]|uniref:site-specific integrase n=1 Tax=Clostridium culturomicium TaxID=1499683 RepID=UPI00385765B7